MNKKITAIIIEDEEPARDLIKAYLKDYKNIILISECDNGFAGFKAINEHKPDIIFLDIQMPKLSGFEMLELLDEIPGIIFTTAYDNFAIKAFDINAVDYLLKPFSRERFQKSIEKAFDSLENKKKKNKKVYRLIEHVHRSKDMLERVVVKSGSKINVIPVDEIQHVEAQDDYVMIYTKNEKYLKQETMNYFEEHLPASHFIRIHRSDIVKLDQIIRMEHYAKDNFVVILKNGNNIKVSKSRIKELKKELRF
ncbi:MAG: LytTR family transcriptional regulator DNA-binding domain-containing protein [Bacteroidales bacterium]|nr:LytTR family transcriptional regulator DNA-binding domain-containing protein [Bacteroidales bacterium]